MHHEQLVGFRAAQEDNTVCNSKTLAIACTRTLSAASAVAHTALSCLRTERRYTRSPSVTVSVHPIRHATRHRHPILNGYSGLVPPDYDRVAREVRRLTDASAVEFLRGRGVTHVVVHHRRYGRHYFAAVRASRAFDLIASDQDVSLFRLRR